MTNSAPTDHVYTTMPSPVGTLTLIAGDRGLAAILWEADRADRVHAKATKPNPDHAILIETRRQLDEYFAGKRTQFELPLDLIGTAFQKTVWNELLAIPYGETRTYGDLARRLGNMKAIRAVGAANGRNPISIIVPCHRVIGASGDLTGFAGGLDVKAHLLNFESGATEFNFEGNAA